MASVNILTLWAIVEGETLGKEVYCVETDIRVSETPTQGWRMWHRLRGVTILE